MLDKDRRLNPSVAVLPNSIAEAMMQTYVVPGYVYVYVVVEVLIRLGAVVSGEKCDLGLRHWLEWQRLTV